MEPTKPGLTGKQWTIAVTGLVVTALVAQLLPGALLSLLFSGLPGTPDDGIVSGFVLSVGGLATVAVLVLSGLPFVSRLRHWWAGIAGLLMTLASYLALTVWATVDTGEVDRLLQQFGVLVFLGVRLGPFWLTLLVCSLGIMLIRRLTRQAPREGQSEPGGRWPPSGSNGRPPGPDVQPPNSSPNI